MSVCAKPPAVEVLEDNRVRTTCLKCGDRITIVFPNNRESAEKLVAAFDVMPGECPGYHVELTGWRRRWQMDEAMDALFGKEVK